MNLPLQKFSILFVYLPLYKKYTHAVYFLYVFQGSQDVYGVYFLYGKSIL